MSTQSLSNASTLGGKQSRIVAPAAFALGDFQLVILIILIVRIVKTVFVYIRQVGYLALHIHSCRTSASACALRARLPVGTISPSPGRPHHRMCLSFLRGQVVEYRSRTASTSIRKSFNIFSRQLREGVIDANVHTSPVVSTTSTAIKVVFPHHCELRIEGDSYSSIGRKLERSTVVERSTYGLVTLFEHRVLDFGCQSLVLSNGLFGLLTFLARLLEDGSREKLSFHVCVNVLLLHGESSLDRLFTSPVLSMCFALNENSLGLHATIPSQSKCLGAFGLLQSAFVQVPFIGVVVNGQVLQDNKLQFCHIIGMNPVFGRLADETGLASAGSTVTLDGISTIKLNKLGEVVDIGDDVAEILLKQHKLFLGRAVLTKPALVKAANNFFDLTLAHSNATGNLHSLHLLLRVNLFQLFLELADEACLIIFGPFGAFA
ncbi:hypothetical protein HG531_002306 [Fusarium graminearum]|nr:hypothetical protein HG531_002306 [Fusarium graminearum]